jgi:hypothetical protein
MHLRTEFNMMQMIFSKAKSRNKSFDLRTILIACTTAGRILRGKKAKKEGLHQLNEVERGVRGMAIFRTFYGMVAPMFGLVVAIR